MANAQPVQPGQTKLLATFYIRETLCALDAACVQEVIRMGPLTEVRHAGPEVAGVINLRGRIVTILDAGVRLGADRLAPAAENRVFVIDYRNEFIGMLVDRAEHVIEISEEGMEPTPANLPASQERFIKGVYRRGQQVLALIDVDAMLAGDLQ